MEKMSLAAPMAASRNKAKKGREKNPSIWISPLGAALDVTQPLTKSTSGIQKMAL